MRTTPALAALLHEDAQHRAACAASQAIAEAAA